MLRHGCRALVDDAGTAFETATDGADPVEALRHLVTRAVPTTEGFRIGTTVWLAYLAMSVGDPEIARLVAEAKRGQEEFAVRLLTAAAAAGSCVEASTRCRSPDD